MTKYMECENMNVLGRMKGWFVLGVGIGAFWALVFSALFLLLPAMLTGLPMQIIPQELLVSNWVMFGLGMVLFVILSAVRYSLASFVAYFTSPILKAFKAPLFVLYWIPIEIFALLLTMLIALFNGGIFAVNWVAFIVMSIVELVLLWFVVMVLQYVKWPLPRE